MSSSPFYLLLHFSSVPFWLISVSPKHLLQAPVINTCIHVKRNAKTSTGKYKSMHCRKTCCSFTETLSGSMYWTSFPNYCICTKPHKMLRISNQLQPGGVLLYTKLWTFGFHKMCGISWLCQNQLASKKGFCSMEYETSNQCQQLLTLYYHN